MGLAPRPQVARVGRVVSVRHLQSRGQVLQEAAAEVEVPVFLVAPVAPVEAVTVVLAFQPLAPQGPPILAEGAVQVAAITQPAERSAAPGVQVSL